MSVGELQNFTFTAKYARWLPEKKRRETWKESNDRVKNMMLEKYPGDDIRPHIDFAYDMMYKKRVLGSQRALQFGGKPIHKAHARGYNCVSSYVDRLRFFQECMYLLLCGCVPPNTSVLTANGPKEIKDIIVGDLVWSYNKNLNNKQLKKVIATHNIYVPKDDNIQIKGKFGSFTTSKKHPVLVLRNGNWEYIPASNIKLGDTIQKAFFEENSVEFDKKAYVAGFFMGDGTSNILKNGSRRIRACGDNYACLCKFAKCLEDLSGEKVKCKTCKDKRYSVKMWNIEKTFSKDNWLTLNWHNIVGQLPSKKTYITNIPDWIKSSYNKSIVMSFVAGIIDSDGNVEADGKIFISTSSKNMKDDLLSILPIYGIYPWVSEISVDSYNSNGYQPTCTQYRIIFSMFEMKKYNNFLGHNIKSDKIDKFTINNKSQHKTLVVPICDIQKEIDYLDLEKCNGSIFYNFKYQIEKRGTCRAGYYISRNKSFYHLMEYDQVIEINDNLDIDCDFKDITVEDNHSYLCGDGSYYTLHNCGTGYSIQKHHIDKLPQMLTSKEGSKKFVISDSIEGWSDAIGVLVSSYFQQKGLLQIQSRC